MKKYNWYEFTFADGTTTICRGYSANELKWEQLRHGKLVSKVFYEYA